MTEFIFRDAELFNAKTKRPYLLVPGERVSRTPSMPDDIAEVCNEGPIYDLLFKEKLKAAPYSAQDALNFIDWIQLGWQKNSFFVFFIFSDEGKIVGCCDIKSNDQSEAEIGYWLSAKHTGVMTPAVEEMKRQALRTGFRKLIAFTVPDNRKSQTVLERCRFTFVGEFEKNGRLMNKYQTERNLHAIV